MSVGQNFIEIYNYNYRSFQFYNYRNHTILLLMFMVLLSIGIILMSLPRAVSRGTQTIKYKGEKPI